MEPRRFFRLPEIKRPSNPLTSQGVRALAIVLVVIFFISAAAYIGLIKTKKGPSVLPATVSQEEVTPELEPTEELTPTSVVEKVSPTANPSPTDEVATPSARRIEVGILDFSFQPANIVTGRGSTIVWINKDTVNHTVTAEDGKFGSGSIAPGDSFTQRFDKIRTYSYSCRFHPEIKGTVTIQ